MKKRTIILAAALVAATAAAAGASSAAPTREACRARMQTRIAEIRATPNLRVPAGAPTYYLSEKSGDDAADGRTPATAWRTPARLAKTSPARGSFVLFERGGVYRGTVKAAPGVTYSAYGTGRKPRIFGSPEDGAVPAKWTRTDCPNVWSYDIGHADVGALVFNDGESCATKVLIRTDRKSGAKTDLRTGRPFASYRDLKDDLHFWHDYYKDGTGKVYLVSDRNPGERFRSVEFNVKCHGFAVGGADGVTIDNVEVRYVGAHGVGAGTCRDLTVSNCEFAWIGGSIQAEGIFGRDHPTRFGNAVEVYGGCDGYRVTDCYAWQVYDAGVTHQFNVPDSAGLKPFDQRNVTYARNVFEKCNYSIEYFLTAKNGNPSRMENVLFEDNLCFDAGSGFCEQRPDLGNGAHVLARWSKDRNRATNFVVRRNVFCDSRDALVLIYSGLKNPDGSSSLPSVEGNVFIGRAGGSFGAISDADCPRWPCGPEAAAVGAFGAGNVFRFDGARAWLEDLEISGMSCGWRKPQVGKSVRGNPLSLGGKAFAHGVGTHAPSRLLLPLGGKALAFEATVGIDDDTKSPNSSVEFQVWADGKMLATSGLLKGTRRTATLKAGLAGVQVLRLEVTDGGDGKDSDSADWADAVLTLADGVSPADLPKAADLTEQLGVLTPAAPATPRINGPAVFGVRPGSPIVYRVPVTGERPMKVSVTGLPEGATFDAASATIRGAVARRGDYRLTFAAENAKGRATRAFTLAVGDALALTPPMGWNSWNNVGHDVSHETVKAAADAMVASGLADHGWRYVVIDDYWQNRPGEEKDRTLMGIPRASDGTIKPNVKFPAMNALTDYVHSLGLLAGIYSSPGPTTCGRNEGSWMHEVQDAKTFADWGFDFLKYDWCSYGGVAFGRTPLDRARLPFLLMGQALRAQGRDIVFSLCQYGMENVSAWGATAYGSCWRTTGDVFDTWPSISGAIDKQADLWPWSRPGAWNDPDMLCVGKMRWNGFKGSRLTPNEQYTHMSIWCLVASPLMIGCDMAKLDDFTFGLLSNDEVLAVDQDPLGAGAAKIDETDSLAEVWARPLADGSVAVGLVNGDLRPQTVVFDLAAAGLEGSWAVRDLWRQRDEGEVRGRYAVRVPGHATHLVRLRPARDGRFAAGYTDVRDLSWMREYGKFRPVAPSRK